MTPDSADAQPDPAGQGADWPWPPSLDAVVAAPRSHRVLLDTAEVRVLEIDIPPGAREPLHTHRWPSVLLIDRPARIRYYGEDGALRFESADPGRRQAHESSIVEWLAPEGPHAVENVDTGTYHAIRVELKGSIGGVGGSQ